MLSKVSAFAFRNRPCWFVLPNKMLGPYHSPGRLPKAFSFFGTVFSQFDISLLTIFLKFFTFLFPPQLVPSGLTTGTSSTCRRTSFGGDVTFRYSHNFLVSMTISYLHTELLALNISLVTAKDSSHHLNPCMLMFSDFAWRLLKSSHDQN